MSSTNNNHMVSPGKKPSKKYNGKKNTKKKVVAATSVKSPIVKGTVTNKQATTNRKVVSANKNTNAKVTNNLKTNNNTANKKPVVKTVNSTKQTVKKPATKTTTNKKVNTVAKNVNKNTANAVKTTTKAVNASNATKATTKGVKAAATAKTITKNAATATNITKSKNNKTKGVAKAATAVNKKTIPKKPVVVQTEEDLNKQIDKYIVGVGIPSVSTAKHVDEEKTEIIEDVVDIDYSRTKEYKDLAAELREQAEKEAREQYEKELELSRTTITRIEDSVINEINKENEITKEIPDLSDLPDHISTGETIELSSVTKSLEDTSSYQDIDEALKHEIKKHIDKEEKKTKKGFTFYKLFKAIFAIALLATSGLFGYTAINSGYLPSKYSIAIIAVLAIINLFVIFMLCRKHKVFNFMGIVLIIAFSTIFMVGYNYLDNTFDVLKDFLAVKETTTKYYYVVLKDAAYTTPKDLENQTVGIVNTNSDNVMNKISEDYILSYTQYDTAGTMIYGLQLHEIEGMVMSTTTYDLMKENDENFEGSVKVIGEVEVNGEPEEIESTIEANKSFVLYISGVDTRDTSSVPEYGLSDVNMLAVVNPTAHRVLLVNIPRDYYVQLHGTEGKLKDKLTHAGLYGVGMSMNTLGDLFNVEVNAYVRVNFTTVTTLVDDIDGVDIYSDISFNSFHMPGWVVPRGTSHMNGKQALAFARERYAYQSGDRHRGENQQAVITAIINKLSTNKKYLLNYDKILGDIAPYFVTNIKEADIQALVKEQLNTMPSWTVESISVNGTNSSNYTYSWPTQYSYVMLPDANTVNTAKAKMAEVMKS